MCISGPPRRSARSHKEGGGFQTRQENIEKAIHPDLYVDPCLSKTKGVDAGAVGVMPTNPMAPVRKATRRSKVSYHLLLYVFD